MDDNRIRDLISNNRGKILGGLTGLLVALLLLTLGLFKSLFVVIAILIGIYFGADSNNWMRLKRYISDLFGSEKRQ